MKNRVVKPLLRKLGANARKLRTERDPFSVYDMAGTARGGIHGSSGLGVAPEPEQGADRRKRLVPFFLPVESPCSCQNVRPPGGGEHFFGQRIEQGRQFIRFG